MGTQLWDVCSDQEAVDLVRNIADPQTASKQLVDHALARFSTDNLSCMIVRFDNNALKARRNEASIGVQGDAATGTKGESEADAIVESVKRHIDETGEVPAMVEANSNTSAGEGMMADIEEHPGEEEDADSSPEVNEAVLKEAQEKSKNHDGGS